MFGGQALAGLVFGLYGFLVTFRSCEPRTRDTQDTRDTRDTRGGGGGDGKTHGKPWENPWGIFQETHGQTGMTGED